MYDYSPNYRQLSSFKPFRFQFDNPFNEDSAQIDRISLSMTIADITIPRAHLLEESSVDVASEYERRVASIICQVCKRNRRMCDFPMSVGWPCVHALYACRKCIGAQIHPNVRKPLVDRLLDRRQPANRDDVSGDRFLGSDLCRCIARCNCNGGSETGRTRPTGDYARSTGDRRRENGRVHRGRERRQRGFDSEPIDSMPELQLSEEPPHMPIVRCVAPKCGALLPLAALASVDVVLAKAVASRFVVTDLSHYPDQAAGNEGENESMWMYVNGFGAKEGRDGAVCEDDCTTLSVDGEQDLHTDQGEQNGCYSLCDGEDNVRAEGHCSRTSESALRDSTDVGVVVNVML